MLLHVLLLLLVLYTFFAYLLSKKRSSLPPGPAPWLFFGNVPDFVYAQIQGKNAVQVLIEWKEKYGNVFTIWLGPMPTINVCDYKTAVDAFVKNGDAHVGRFRTHLAFVTRGVYGLLFSEGQCWQEQRRFCLHVLKNFGLGRNLMQERILDEIRFSFERIDKTIEMNRSAVIDPADVFDPLVGSVINKIASGQRFDESNMETFFQIKRDLDQSVTRTSAFDHALLGATSTRFPFFKQRLEYLKTSHLNLRKWLIDNIEERKAKIANGSHLLVESDPCDYIDAYFLEMERRKKSGEPMDSFCIDALVSNLMDFWLAGMETTILTFMWATIYLLKYPEVHEKVYKEIVNCTGGNRYLELCDKLDTPYFNAVITETQRHANVLNFNLWHKTTTKTMVGEYLIPEGVTIAPQLSVIMSNEAAFKNSCKFDPDRYLNSKLGEEVIPFGIGKRSCLGEGLAKAELHLILGNFIQQYRIYVPEGEEAPSTEPATPFGLMHRNKHFTCAIERRATS
ncbi:hypothetical protein L596_029327 [Steinernema carpocapsae]|uniref:Cytochrome P450 n=1 Tax=Steinernema carpocapsae TaxID=34508 RepID=A0A4U5LUB5_STECR|nr:hypothetical protein L596_029327 [Steinernema carpocapsae]